MSSFIHRSVASLKEELRMTWDSIRNTRWSLGFFFAIFCVLFVIVGNVVLLVAINFWIVAFPTETVEHNSSQIAIQVVALIFLVLLFSICGVIFTIVYGAYPLWRILTATDRVGGPLYRLFLLFSSGLTNGVSSLLGIYAITYTPEFIQAVLLCCIPFSAQAWTVIFIPIERKRNYLSLFFIGSFVLFVAGVLLSSLSAFLHPSSEAEVASWAWALIYLVSAVIFGLWCVVQRLYLDAVVLKATTAEQEQQQMMLNAGSAGVDGSARDSHRAAKELSTCPRHAQSSAAVDEARANEPTREEAETAATMAHRQATDGEPTSATKKVDGHGGAAVEGAYATEDMRYSDMDDEEELPTAAEEEMLMKRQWGNQSVDSNAAKVVLLLVGLLFQLLISFVLFPIDAIPWFGTSSTALESWEGFRNSIDFIFASWENIRFGLLYSLGFAMSFIGCTYLNEHSPTLASVVLQLAGPITSLVIIIIPQWNVYKSSNSVGQQVGGVILLLVAALLYHLWEQQSLRRLMVKAEEAALRRQQQQERHELRDDERAQ